jgi:hypothetical protein
MTTEAGDEERRTSKWRALWNIGVMRDGWAEIKADI